MADPGLNVDPLRPGPFAGIPRTTQLLGFPYGTLDINTSSERRGLFYGSRVMPQFTLGTRTPAAGESYSLNYGPLAIPHGVTLVNSGAVKAFVPLFMGVGRFVGAGTIPGGAMITDSDLDPYGTGKWGLSYKSDSYNVNSLGQTKYPVSAGAWPGLAYVWRAGVGVVSYIFSAFSFSANNVAPPVYDRTKWQEWWAAKNGWMCTGYSLRNVEMNHLITAPFQADDYLIVEYFAVAWFSAQSATATVGACYLAGTVNIGGGQNHAPINSAGYNSQTAGAPTQNTQVPLNLGVTPAFTLPTRIVQPHCSVGF